MRGDTGGNRTPQWHKIRIEQTHGAESDHRDREDSETYARDAHRRGLRLKIQFNGNLMNASISPRSEHMVWPISESVAATCSTSQGAAGIKSTKRDSL